MHMVQTYPRVAAGKILGREPSVCPDFSQIQPQAPNPNKHTQESAAHDKGPFLAEVAKHLVRL